MSILEILAAAQKANQFALDLQGRMFGLMFGLVTQNEDPLQLRRIKVSLEHQGGLTESDWVMAMRLIPNYDPPLPRIGTSVIVAAIAGDPHDLIWLGPVINQTNPQDHAQADPINDNTQTIPGASTETIGGKFAHTVQQVEDRRTEKNLTISGGERITIVNDAGSSLILHESGAVILNDKWNNRLVLGGQSGGLNEPSDFVWNTTSGDCRWNLGNHALRIENASDVSIAAKSVATIGATDSDNDVLTSRGW